MTQSPWQLNDERLAAQFQLGTNAGYIKLQFPQLGWHGLQNELEGFAISAGGLLLPGVNEQEPLTTSTVHVRGADLVATYPASESRPFVTDVYRTAESIQLGDIEVPLISTLISLHTHLLDATPTISLRSIHADTDQRLIGNSSEELAAEATASTANPTKVLIRPNDRAISYVELVDPIDFEEIECASDRWQRRFAEPMEKGVIRRIRVWGAIIPRANDLELTDQLQSEFFSAAPPLTA